MRLYFVSVNIGSAPVCAGHVAAETAQAARDWMKADFFKPVNTIVRQDAPEIASFIEATQARARAEGFEIVSRASKAPMSNAINL